jgi:hypothetical protein
VELTDIKLHQYTSQNGGQMNFDHIQLLSDIKSAIHSANNADYKKVEIAEWVISECVAVFEKNSIEAVAYNFMVLGQVVGWLQKDSSQLTPEMMEISLKATQLYYDRSMSLQENNRPAKLLKSMGIKLSKAYWVSNPDARTGEVTKYVIEGLHSYINDKPWRDYMEAKGLKVEKLRVPTPETVKKWLVGPDKPESAKKGGAPKTGAKK